MRLSIDNLSILDHITQDSAGATTVTLELRGKKSSVLRINYENGWERVRLAWDETRLLTPECNEKVMRALRDDARLSNLLTHVLTEDEDATEPATEDTHGLAALQRHPAPPTMFI